MKRSMVNIEFKVFKITVHLEARYRNRSEKSDRGNCLFRTFGYISSVKL